MQQFCRRKFTPKLPNHSANKMGKRVRRGKENKCNESKENRRLESPGLAGRGWSNWGGNILEQHLMCIKTTIMYNKFILNQPLEFHQIVLHLFFSKTMCGTNPAQKENGRRWGGIILADVR